MSPEIIEDLKSFYWQTLIDWGNSLSDLNDAQFRFIKGYAVETAVETYSNGSLVYVGEKHKDFDCPKWEIVRYKCEIPRNGTIELKSQLSSSVYTKTGKLRKEYGVKLNNSNGTNKHATINPDHVCDIILVVRNDGAFAISKETIIKYAVSGGDGFSVIVPKDEIVLLTDKIIPQQKFVLNLKEKIINAIRESLPPLPSV